jgi:hypothetical protein
LRGIKSPKSQNRSKSPPIPLGKGLTEQSLRDPRESKIGSVPVQPLSQICISLSVSRHIALSDIDAPPCPPFPSLPFSLIADAPVRPLTSGLISQAHPRATGRAVMPPRPLGRAATPPRRPASSRELVGVKVLLTVFNHATLDIFVPTMLTYPAPVPPNEALKEGQGRRAVPSPGGEPRPRQPPPALRPRQLLGVIVTWSLFFGQLCASRVYVQECCRLAACMDVCGCLSRVRAACAG